MASIAELDEQIMVNVFYVEKVIFVAEQDGVKPCKPQYNYPVTYSKFESAAGASQALALKSSSTGKRRVT